MEKQDPIVSTHWETRPWPSKCLGFQDAGSDRKHLWQRLIGHQGMWLQRLLRVFWKTHLQVHLAGGAASLTLAGKLCRTHKNIFSCLRLSCSPWYSQGLRLKHGNNATNVSEGLACYLQDSLGSGWLLCPCLWAIRAYHFIPRTCDHTMNIYVFFTCITAIQSIQWL